MQDLINDPDPSHVWVNQILHRNQWGHISSLKPIAISHVEGFSFYIKVFYILLRLTLVKFLYQSVLTKRMYWALFVDNFIVLSNSRLAGDPEIKF